MTLCPPQESEGDFYAEFKYFNQKNTHIFSAITGIIYKKQIEIKMCLIYNYTISEINVWTTERFPILFVTLYYNSKNEKDENK